MLGRYNRVGRCISGTDIFPDQRPTGAYLFREPVVAYWDSLDITVDLAMADTGW